MSDVAGDALATKWLQKIEERRVACGAAKFIQLVVPEKSSVLHDLSPFPATRGTPAYRALRKIAPKHTFIDLLAESRGAFQ